MAPPATGKSLFALRDDAAMDRNDRSTLLAIFSQMWFGWEEQETERERFMKIVIVVLVILVGLIAVGWLGLRVRPRPFPPLAQPSPALKTVPLPAGLPAPVERYYRQLYGDQVPVIESAVITGRATMSPVGGLKLPARFRFVHQVGSGLPPLLRVDLVRPDDRHGERALSGWQEPPGAPDGAERRRTPGGSGGQPEPVGGVRLAARRLPHRPARALGAGG